MVDSIGTVIGRFYNEYMQSTSKKIKLIDSYLFYIVLTGVIQFAYCCLVGTFPFNSFLSGFISCVGSFVLAGKAQRTRCTYSIVAYLREISVEVNLVCI